MQASGVILANRLNSHARAGIACSDIAGTAYHADVPTATHSRIMRQLTGDGMFTTYVTGEPLRRVQELLKDRSIPLVDAIFTSLGQAAHAIRNRKFVPCTDYMDHISGVRGGFHREQIADHVETLQQAMLGDGTIEPYMSLRPEHPGAHDGPLSYVFNVHANSLVEAYDIASRVATRLKEAAAGSKFTFMLENTDALPAETRGDWGHNPGEYTFGVDFTPTDKSTVTAWLRSIASDAGIYAIGDSANDTPMEEGSRALVITTAKNSPLQLEVQQLAVRGSDLSGVPLGGGLSCLGQTDGGCQIFTTERPGLISLPHAIHAVQQYRLGAGTLTTAA